MYESESESWVGVERSGKFSALGVGVGAEEFQGSESELEVGYRRKHDFLTFGVGVESVQKPELESELYFVGFEVLISTIY